MKIFLLADYYPQYLKSFYADRNVKGLSYHETKKMLLQDYFGSFVSYYYHLKKIGHTVRLVIGNDAVLQGKWLEEHGIKGRGMSKYDLVLRQVGELRPDVFFIGSMFDYYGSFLKKVSLITRNIFAWIACPFRDDLDFSNIVCIISSADEYAELFRRRGMNAEHLRAAFDGEIVRLLDNRKTIDASFIGGLSKKTHRHRVEGLEHVLRSGIKLKTFGYGLERNLFPFVKSQLRKSYCGELWGIEMYRTLNHSRISLNFHIDVAKGFSGNMRMFEATGCGSLLMTENTPDTERIFQPGKEVVVYDNADDLVDKIKYYLARETERESIVKAGQEACLERHGYDKRVIEFERILLRYC